MAASSRRNNDKSLSFQPVLLAGPGGDARVQAAEALGRLFDVPVEQTTLDRARRQVTRRRSSVAVGMLAVLPDAATDLRELLGPLVTEIRAADPTLPLVLVGDGLDGRETALAFRLGVQDVLFLRGAEPGDPGLDALASCIQRRAARAAGSLFGDTPGAPRLIGRAPAMREMARLVERVAKADATVLILGESGTGKELVARAVHAFSPRAKGPFVAINCAAIPETLLENELFGHEKGAYTGASSAAGGKVEAAEGGTLFLDEIGEMPLPLQAKILRLLQDHTYDRIGGTRMRTADIRIVAATNRDLRQAVAAGTFREDLYYRLSVVPLTLPALRERPEDVPLLANHVLERLAERLGRPGLHIAPEAMQRLVAYRWPGNVRELENELERAAVLAHGDEIGPTDLELRPRVEDPDKRALARWVPLDVSLEEAVEQAQRTAERFRISMAMERAGGDRAQAAAELGITEEELAARLEPIS